MALSSSPLIELTHASVVFDGHAALDDVSFALRAGERWALVGPNGSGKTMLLKLLRGDMWPTDDDGSQRRYVFDGEASAAPRDLKHFIAYVGPERQDKYVRYGWNLTVSEVVATGLFDEDIPLTKPTRAQLKRVANMLRRFGIAGLRRRRLLSLSYGQRRLVLLARAFISPARVLLLDEVFNGLDAHAREKLRNALERPRGRHAWVLSSHRPHELPKSVTHLARIESGRLVAQGAKSARNSLDRQVVRRSPRKPPRRASAHVGRAAKPFIVIRDATLYRDYRPVIRDLSWTIERGQHWAVLGPNGSGKSTLLSLLYGDLHPALGGEIERAGAPRGSRIEDWKRRVGWLSPELQADHYLARSIEEIVISGRYASVGLNAPPTRADRAHAQRWLEFFGLESLRDRGPRQASYGQMRLALFARTMINDPELLLLDEPYNGLDAEVRATLQQFVERLALEGVQLIMAVHDREDIASAVNHVLHIGKGGRVTLENA